MSLKKNTIQILKYVYNKSTLAETKPQTITLLSLGFFFFLSLTNKTHWTSVFKSQDYYGYNFGSEIFTK